MYGMSLPKKIEALFSSAVESQASTHLAIPFIDTELIGAPGPVLLVLVIDLERTLQELSVTFRAICLSLHLEHPQYLLDYTSISYISDVKFQFVAIDEIILFGSSSIFSIFVFALQNLFLYGYGAIFNFLGIVGTAIFVGMYINLYQLISGDYSVYWPH